MPSATLAQTLADRYHLDVAEVDRILHADDKCGRGWEGTKPGCVRAKKGGAKTAPALGQKAEGQATQKAKVEAAIAQKRAELKKQGKTATVAELKKAGEAALKPETKKRQNKTASPDSPEQKPQQADDLATLRKNYKEKDARTLGNVTAKFTDVGNLTSLYADEVKAKGKSDRGITAAFDRGERNFNPALVIETGKDEYQAIGGISEKIAASAKASKEGRAYSVIVPNNPEQIELAKMMQVPDKTDAAHVKPEQKQRSMKEGGSGFSDNGNYQHLYTDEIATDLSSSKKHKGTPEQVDAAAKQLLKTNGRNWVPVLVHENADGTYKVVGNHFAHDVVRRAGIDRAWTVQVSSDRDKRKDALDQLHEDAKWDKCGKGYAPPGTCKAGKPSGTPVSSRHILEPHADPFSDSGQKQQQGRAARIDQLVSKLEAGRFKPKANDPNGHGKQGALTALKDAKNPRIGLFTSHNKDGQMTGAMSYKEGKTLISVQNFGADGSTKGSGSEMFNQLLHHAAKLGKGIEASSVDSAKGFYTKMGMTDEGYGQFSMSKQAVAAAIAKLSSRKDAMDDRLTLAKLIGEELQSPELYGAPIRFRKFDVQGRTVTGEFVGTADGRSYAFTYSNGKTNYKPAVAKLDSESVNQFIGRWDSHTEALEVKVSNPVRLDAAGKRLKCGSATYQCGGICQGVHRECHKNEKAAVNHERVKKINDLIDHLNSGGDHPMRGLDKPDAAKLKTKVAKIQETRDLRAANTIAKRAGDRTAKIQPTEAQAPSVRQQAVAASLPKSGSIHERQAQGGTFTHPLTGALMYKYKSPTDSELKNLGEDGSLDFYRKQAAKFNIKHESDRDLVARVEAWRSKTQAPDIQAHRAGLSSHEVLKQAAEEINDLPAYAFADQSKPATMTVGTIAPGTDKPPRLIPQSAAVTPEVLPPETTAPRSGRSAKLAKLTDKLQSNHEADLKNSARIHAVAHAAIKELDPSHTVQLPTPISSTYLPPNGTPKQRTQKLLTDLQQNEAASNRNAAMGLAIAQTAVNELKARENQRPNRLEAAPVVPKAKGRTAGDLGDTGKYRHVSIDSISSAITRLQQSGVRIDSATAIDLLRRADACKCEQCQHKDEKQSKYDRLIKSLAAKGADDPKALAAAIGRRKFGKKRFQAKAAAGAKKAAKV